MEILDNVPQKSSIKPQVLVALAASFGSFGFGAGITWTSPAFPRINKDICQDNCDISNVDGSTASWIGTIFLIGSIISGPVAFLLLSKIGRRWTLIGLTGPMLLGYGLLTITKTLDSIDLMLTGRFLAGFSGAAYNLLGPLYISEISEPRIRGALASFTQLMIASGIAFVNGWSMFGFADWVAISGLCIGIPVILMVSLIFIPETPQFLVEKNKLDEARSSLSKLRGKGVDIEPELQEIIAAKEEADKIGSIGAVALFTNKIYLAPLLLGLFGMFNLQSCGVTFVQFYLQPICVKSGSTMDQGLAAFIVAITQVVASFPSVLLVDKYGRRPLLIIGNVFMMVSHFALGAYFYLDENKCPSIGENELQICLLDNQGFSPALVSSLGWLPLVSLMVYVVAFSIGIGPLAWALNAELYSPEGKKLSASIAFTACWFFAFLFTQFTPALEAAINTSGLFFFFGSACLLAVIVDYFLMPETKCKTPEDMKQYFESKLG